MIRLKKMTIQELFLLEGYIVELTRLSQCLNAKTGLVHFWSVYQSFLYWIFMFQIVHFQKILEGQCLNKNRLTAPLYILLAPAVLVWYFEEELWFKLCCQIHLSNKLSLYRKDNEKRWLVKITNNCGLWFLALLTIVF